jgi:hypothetical protein
MAKPGKIQIISILSLVNGIINILYGIFLIIGFLTFGVSTLGVGLILGIICCPLSIAPIVLGIFEILYASKLMSNPPRPVQPGKTIAILDIVCIIFGNMLSLAAGIVMLVMYNDPEVLDWFDELNNPVNQAYLP